MNLITIVEKLDTIIKLLTPPSVTSSNEHSLQSRDITEAKKRESQLLRLVVERNAKGKRVRDGYLNEDGSVEWIRSYK